MVAEINAEIDRARVYFPVGALAFSSKRLVILVKADILGCFVEGHDIDGQQTRVAPPSYKQWADLKRRKPVNLHYISAQKAFPQMIELVHSKFDNRSQGRNLRTGNDRVARP